MSGSVLFEDAEIQVVHRPGNSAFTLVTFGELSTRPGGLHFWGRELARTLDLDAVGVVGKRENWFPAASLAAAAGSIRAVLKPGSIGYGYSMGGYAALKHAALLGLEASFAVSPQTSIMPAEVPGDERYRNFYRPALHDGMAVRAEDLGPRAVILADPYDAIDWRHAERIRALAPERVRLIRAPLTGHSAIWLLVGSAGFRPVLDALRAGDAAGMQAALRARRGRSEQWFRLMAMCAMRHGNASRARLLSAQAVALGVSQALVEQDEATALEHRIAWLLRLGRQEEAAAAARMLGAQGGGAGGNALRGAHHLLAMGRAAEARLAFEEAIRLGLSDGHAHAGLAASLSALGQDEEALAALRAAVAREPAEPALALRLGHALLGRGLAAEAAAAFQAVVAHDPRSLGGRSGLAHALLAQGDGAAALPHARFLVREQPQDAEAASLLGRAFHHLGSPMPALRECSRAAQLAADQPRFHLLLAEVLLAHRGPRPAARALREALKTLPGEPGLTSRLREIEAASAFA